MQVRVCKCASGAEGIRCLSIENNGSGWMTWSCANDPLPCLRVAEQQRTVHFDWLYISWAPQLKHRVRNFMPSAQAMPLSKQRWVSKSQLLEPLNSPSRFVLDLAFGTFPLVWRCLAGKRGLYCCTFGRSEGLRYAGQLPKWSASQYSVRSAQASPTALSKPHRMLFP